LGKSKGATEEKRDSAGEKASKKEKRDWGTTKMVMWKKTFVLCRWGQAPEGHEVERKTKRENCERRVEANSKRKRKGDLQQAKKTRNEGKDQGLKEVALKCVQRQKGINGQKTQQTNRYKKKKRPVDTSNQRRLSNLVLDEEGRQLREGRREKN